MKYYPIRSYDNRHELNLFLKTIHESYLVSPLNFIVLHVVSAHVISIISVILSSCKCNLTKYSKLEYVRKFKTI